MREYKYSYKGHIVFLLFYFRNELTTYLKKMNKENENERRSLYYAYKLRHNNYYF